MISLMPAPASLPEGQRVYAIGDVHGCADKLAALHALIAEDLAARPVEDATLLHLGDYIDRGEDSAGAIARITGPPPAHGLKTVALMGNHEAMMLTAFDQRDDASVFHWLSNGGADTLASWGVPRRAPPTVWAAIIPQAHIAWLRALPVTHSQGGYLFVHAGLRPGLALDKQSREDMLWIREPFLTFKGALPAVVVHGHTPVREVERRPNRIGVDTGAVMGGKLSCVVLEADRMGVLRV